MIYRMVTGYRSIITNRVWFNKLVYYSTAVFVACVVFFIVLRVIEIAGQKAESNEKIRNAANKMDAKLTAGATKIQNKANAKANKGQPQGDLQNNPQGQQGNPQDPQAKLWNQQGSQEGNQAGNQAGNTMLNESQENLEGQNTFDDTQQNNTKEENSGKGFKLTGNKDLDDKIFNAGKDILGDTSKDVLDKLTDQINKLR